MTEPRPVVPITRGRLSDDVASAIREAIFTGRLKPGDTISQTEWAETLGVSRMPIRDAIARLCAEGTLILDRRGGSRAIVTELTLQDLRDGYELSAHVLGLLAMRAADRITDDSLARLEKMNAELAQAVEGGDGGLMSRINRRFHREVNLAAGSPRLLAFVRVAEISIPHSTFEHSGWPKRCLKDHQALTEALARRDADASASLMRAHIDAGSRLMLQVLADRF
jgi:DNA-binding GntR family transcriptional regulator